MSSDDLDLVLREESGLDPLPPRFSTPAWLRMVDAEVAAAAASGKLEQILGDFEAEHRGEPFVWDNEMEARMEMTLRRRSSPTAAASPVRPPL
jgi:hypothetical protein